MRAPLILLVLSSAHGVDAGCKFSDSDHTERCCRFEFVFACNEKHACLVPLLCGRQIGSSWKLYRNLKVIERIMHKNHTIKHEFRI